MLQCVAVEFLRLRQRYNRVAVCCSVLQRVAACCSGVSAMEIALRSSLPVVGSRDTLLDDVML